MINAKELMLRARHQKTVIPGFNIPYLPMMEPVVRALRDTQSVGLIMVARLEWVKFESGGIKDIYNQYQKVKDEKYTRLHLDHIPVIDEDGHRVDFMADIQEALDLGYDSVMVDGSRLPLEENIAATRKVVEAAHEKNVPVEAELGAIMGHEEGPMPSYEDLFASGKGFTDPLEAKRFVNETSVDWLSVAVGNIHGAISAAKRTEKKVEAKLSIERLENIASLADVPLVLHGGTGIRKGFILEGVHHGIAKINVATAIRQPYETLVDESIEKAQEAVYDTMVNLIRSELEIEGSAQKLGTA
jgi:ketose-bisphosphate aldolase